MMYDTLTKCFTAFISCGLLTGLSTDPAAGEMVAHWKLASDARDEVGALHARNHGVSFENGSAVFNGRDAWLEVPESDSIRWGVNDFSVAVWVYTHEVLDDVLGDVLSYYDPKRQTGMNLSLMNYSGVAGAQSNWRNVLFGIDASQRETEWIDCGRPGDNHYVKSLVVYAGDLYASTWEPGEGQRGHVYRYAGGKRWVDCGAPDQSNAINAMAVYQGRLYVGSELYSGGGSSLPLSPNENHGGHVFRYEGGTRWTNVGKLADVRSIGGLATYRGELYAGTGTTGAWRDTPRKRGMYRLDKAGDWSSCGCPGLRVVHLHVHDGNLYGLSYDDGGFFRYDGDDRWTRMGPVPNTTQVYSAAVYQGDVHVGTWPTGCVYRFGGPQDWTNTGRLGDEQEVMGMAVYNGKLYAGTLPRAEVYRYDGHDEWVSTGQLDTTPDVRYRRAWSMAVFRGKLFCGVLPSGHVFSLEAGKSVTYDRELAPGWHHLAAVKRGGRLGLYVDGKHVADSSPFDPERFNLDVPTSLKIGFGQHDYFYGRMKGLRLYNHALTGPQILELVDE